jgi:hypothetical protein
LNLRPLGREEPEAAIRPARSIGVAKLVSQSAATCRSIRATDEQHAIMIRVGETTEPPESGGSMVGDTGIEPVTPTVSMLSPDGWLISLRLDIPEFLDLQCWLSSMTTVLFGCGVAPMWPQPHPTAQPVKTLGTGPGLSINVVRTSKWLSASIRVLATIAFDHATPPGGTCPSIVPNHAERSTARHLRRTDRARR